MVKSHSVKLVIATVYSYPPELGNSLDTPESQLNEASIRLRKMLNGYREQALGAGVSEVEMRVMAAFSPLENMWAKLVAEAEKMGCPLIVVGTKGTTGIKRTLLGSFADYVVRNAHCDVYVVRKRAAGAK